MNNFRTLFLRRRLRVVLQPLRNQRCLPRAWRPCDQHWRQELRAGRLRNFVVGEPGVNLLNVKVKQRGVFVLQTVDV